MAARSFSDRDGSIAARPSSRRAGEGDPTRRAFALRSAMGIGLAGSEVLEAELCQSLPLFVAHVAIGAPVGERAVNADAPFASRELPEEGAHEPVPQPRERRPDG